MHKLIAFSLSCIGALSFEGEIPSLAYSQEFTKSDAISKCVKHRELTSFFQCKVTAKLSSLHKAKEEAFTSSSNVFKQNKSSVLMIEKQENNGKLISEKVYAINSRYGFILVRQPEKNWLIQDIFLKNPSDAKYGKRDLRDHVLNSIGLGYPYDLANPMTTLSNTYRQKNDAEGDLISIDYERPATKVHPVQSKGTMTFKKSLGYALVHVESISHFRKDTTSSKIDHQYSGDIKGFATLTKRIVRTSTPEGDGFMRTGLSESDYDIVYNESVPDTEFTLSAFGLPEPKGIAWEQPSRGGWVWWGVAGITLVVVGYGIYRWRRPNTVSQSSS